MEVADEVSVSFVVPTVTVTDTPPCEPVSPEMMNPSPCSAMFTVSLPAMGSTVSARAPAASTVTVTVAVAAS